MDFFFQTFKHFIVPLVTKFSFLLLYIFNKIHLTFVDQRFIFNKRRSIYQIWRAEISFN